MRTQDKIYGGLYALLLLMIIPFIAGGIPSFFYWTIMDQFFGPLLHAGIGYAFSGVFAYFFVDRMYVFNKPYTNSFWRDPLFNEHIRRGPGPHFRGWWEVLDTITEHEREITLTISGSYETFGEDNLNLQLTNATLILEIPVEEAMTLRSVGKDMNEIKAEIKSQLTPSLEEAVSAEIAKRKPEYILKNPEKIAQAVLRRFVRDTLSVSRFSALPASFALGNVGFSKEIEEAREQAFRLKSVSQGVQSLVDDSGVNPDLAAKIAFGSLKENELAISVYDVAGLEGGLAGVAKIAADASAATGNVLKLKGTKQPKTKQSKNPKPPTT